MRFLLTGATGELGQALLPALKNHEVETVSRDFPSPGSLGKIDVILHLAGLRYDGGSSAREFTEANVNYTERLLAWLEQSRVSPAPHFIFFSTMYVYGEKSASPLTEESAARPQTAYGASKLAAEKKIGEVSSRLAMPFTLLRLATVYGAGDDILRQLEAGFKRFFPFVLGEGLQKRSLLSIENLKRAVLSASANPRWFGQTVNVADPEPKKMLDLAESVSGGRRVRHLPKFLMHFNGKLKRMSESFCLDTAKLAGLERG